MKGLVQKTESNTVYLAIKHGTLCEESRTDRPGFERREVFNPKTKQTVTRWIKPYAAVEGIITAIEFRDTGQKYEQRYLSWRLHMDAAGVPVILELPFKSRPSSRFMKLAENVDWTKPVEFRAWLDVDDSTAIFIGQDGAKVNQRYSKDHPGECPEPHRSSLDGSLNFSAQNEFLYNRMMSVVIPKIQALQAATTTTDSAEPWNDEPNHIEEPPDDLYDESVIPF